MAALTVNRSRRTPKPKQLPEATPEGGWKCRDEGHDPRLFDSEEHGPAAAEAIAVCDTCPRKALCLKLGRGLRASGVWGGQLLREGVRRRLPLEVVGTFNLEGDVDAVVGDLLSIA